mmetsp:Transcript_35210/g.89507  ORF Transcript_35210/g.89507 Transcript_35210/m.89507 type:complete len:592 (-) Transcript_35210:201-1976(-)
MSVAMLGSLLQREVMDAAMVGVVVALLDTVTCSTIAYVDRRLKGCISVPSANVYLADDRVIQASELKVGMRFQVRKGDAIPADGTVVSGQAAVDESRVTGEARPVDKDKGSKVRSGSLMHSGFLTVTADAEVDASFQNRIQDSVQQAKNTMSGTQEIVGRFAEWYTPAVIAIAVIVAIVRDDFKQFLVIIVAGCPCALLGAAPFVHAVAIAVLAKKHRLLVKETSALESLARIRWLGIDKTGTITTGHFELVHIASVSSWTENELLRFAASVERKDRHPLAQSIVQSYTGCAAAFAGNSSLPDAKNFKREGRCAVMGAVEGHWVAVGNADYLSLQDLDLDGRAAELHKEWSPKGSVLFVVVDEEIAAVIVMADAVRGQARGTIGKLRSLGIQPVLLTGDKGPAAQAAAAAAGIEEVHSGLLPEDKTALVLKASWRGNEKEVLAPAGRGPMEVGFIGDGLNDCPALASANVGIVMQEIGSQATFDAATAVLQGDLGELPAVVVVARRTQRLVVANILLAMALNCTVIAAAAVGSVPLWLSVVADSGGLLAVLANSLWPLCWRVQPVPDESGRQVTSTGGNVGFAVRAGAAGP